MRIINGKQLMSKNIKACEKKVSYINSTSHINFELSVCLDYYIEKQSGLKIDSMSKYYCRIENT